METKTKERLITAAAGLLDSGGGAAVTLRAVAQTVGVSHNAPYKHFADRNAILAAVAERDFGELAAAFAKSGEKHKKPDAALKHAIAAFIAYGRKHPARYRLLFSDPEIASRGGSLEGAALRALHAFNGLVEAYLQECNPRGLPSRTATALIYATMHGLLDLEISGRNKPEKGLGDIEKIAHLLLRLLH
jgi:AcrR family transcriptional regulator